MRFVMMFMFTPHALVAHAAEVALGQSYPLSKPLREASSFTRAYARRSAEVLLRTSYSQILSASRADSDVIASLPSKAGQHLLHDAPQQGQGVPGFGGLKGLEARSLKSDAGQGLSVVVHLNSPVLAAHAAQSAPHRGPTGAPCGRRARSEAL
jgi:hypothetical protein